MQHMHTAKAREVKGHSALLGTGNQLQNGGCITKIVFLKATSKNGYECASASFWLQRW